MLGSRERHGLSIMFNQTEDTILHAAPCDVLAVRWKTGHDDGRCHNRIRVDVSTNYVEDQSNPGEGRFVFSYTITIRNEGDASPPAS